ncbi:cold shock domain-containing protein [Sulfitobacter sp. F26169L]|uniref:cold-shock protein n=1 Tax=Sulfitobacter sp. F26169L TaxID=2996015 RepID=UPI0022608881|nr:cold shock domain-containing protein [Sulfitobacter sp. F26169L]MCX7566163.1 cold shock domain-containing protein [Sulfitobacter sp. F26169L]
MTQTQDQVNQPHRMTGTVKWFDPVKGFGFVVSDQGGTDILLHVNVLRNFGQSSVADGSKVDLLVQQTERGVQASEVLSITPPTGTHTNLEDIAGLDSEEISKSPMVPARIKWFDKAKGFGFANAFGCREDVFVHMDVLRQSGLSDLAPGEAIAMRIILGKRGRMAAEVQAWEAVVLTEEGSSPE